jgi:thiol-disulfide isomerase/thioredoxin
MTFVLSSPVRFATGYTFSNLSVQEFGERTRMKDNKTGRPLPFIIAGSGIILIVIAGYFFLRESSPPADLSTVPAEASFSAPELTLTHIDGTTRSLADYKGKVVLVNLWATWCPPCKEEMPILQAYYDKYHDDNFVVVAINDGDPEQDVRQFVEDYKLTFPVWLDPTYIATEQAFKTLNLPSSYVIDRDGTVRLRWIGEINRKMLEQYVTPIIREN